MCIQAGDVFCRNRTQVRLLRIAHDLVLHNIHLPYVVFGKRAIYTGRNCSQIFADNAALVPVRLHGKDRVEFFRGIFDIDSFVTAESIGNPIQPMQPHHVIDAKQPRETKVISQ